MKKAFLTALLFSFLASGVLQAERAEALPHRMISPGQSSVPVPDDLELKEGCLKAALRALELEQQNYLLKIEAARNGPGDPANIPRFEQRLDELKREFLELKETGVDSYVLPEKKVVRASLGAALKENALLDAEGSTRSGPFYHLAGIRGGDYGALKTGKRYELTLYLVRTRDYPFPDFYVYLADWKEL